MKDMKLKFALKLSFIMLLQQAVEAPEIEFHKKENNINLQQFFSEITL